MDLWHKLRAQSAAIYLSLLVNGAVLLQVISNLWRGEAVFKGQSAALILFFVIFSFAFVSWLGVPRRVPASGLLSVFLTLMTVAWLAHWFLMRLHGDGTDYTAILYVPILIMIWLKPPTLREAKVAILVFAWTVAIVLVLTRVLEMLGSLTLQAQPQGVIDFDEARYFLPVNDLLGIDGRWTGPFGHNGDTAMMGALLIVIAVAFWTRSSWVFIAVGGFALLLTNGRASIGATIAGMIVIVVFAKEGRIARIPRTLRLWGGGAALLLGAILMYSMAAGSTGRSTFWPAFLKLWESAPLVGIGSSGIASSGGVTGQYLHAHNMYIDELARNGLLGFITQYGAITLGVVITVLAAKRGLAGPLAIMTAYLVTGITEPRNGWMSPTATGMLVILVVVTAGVALQRDYVPKVAQVASKNT